MRRSKLILALLVGSLAIVGMSTGAQAQNRALERKLDDTVVSFTFTDQPLQEALDFLATLGNVNIVLDRRQADAGQMITLKLQNVSLRTALKFVTEQVELKWILRDGLVFVSDEEGAKQEPVTMVYDASDLLARAPDFEGPPMELGSLSGTNGNTTSSTPGIFDREDEQDTDSEKSRDELLQDLVELIMQVIEPGSWDDYTP